MEQRLKNYLKFYGETADGSRKIEGDKGDFVADAHTDRIFQHERLIHLIVTVLFAILAVISILASLLIREWAVLLLCLMFFVLLIPYIRHYYILEMACRNCMNIMIRFMQRRRSKRVAKSQ